MNILEIEEELKILESKEISLKEKLRLDNLERLNFLDKKRNLLIELFNSKINSSLLKEEIQKINWKLYYSKHNIIDSYKAGNYEFFNLHFEAESIKGSFIESLIKVLFLDKDQTYKKWFGNSNSDCDLNLRCWEIENPFPREIQFGYCYIDRNLNIRNIGIPFHDVNVLIDFVKKYDIQIDLSLLNSQITDLQSIIGSIQDMNKKLEGFKK